MPQDSPTPESILSPIDALRLLAAALEQGEMPCASIALWFCEKFRAYEQGPADMRLDRALGLLPQPGQESWRTIEAREHRNRAIREIRNIHYQDLGITEAAKEIARLARRAGAVATVCGARQSPVSSLIASALKSGLPLPDARQIENIIRRGGGDVQ
jgi:hypothetical protein